jgi:hypothetical protein
MNCAKDQTAFWVKRKKNFPHENEIKISEYISLAHESFQYIVALYTLPMHLSLQCIPVLSFRICS